MLLYLLYFLVGQLHLSSGTTLAPSLPALSFRPNLSLPNPDIMANNVTLTAGASIDSVLSFWFDPRFPYTRWFIPDPKLDAEISSQFGDLVLLARTTTDLDRWDESPRGCLALTLLLDQFPRNIYRKSADSFTSDNKALSIATRAVARGFGSQLSVVQQAFLHLPFEHEESLLSQVTCVSLFKNLVGQCQPGTQERDFVEKCIDYAVRHEQVIMEFGRFPIRNAVLHRESTAKEIEFLKTHPHGF